MKRRMAMKKIIAVITMFLITAIANIATFALENLHFDVLENTYAPFIEARLSASKLEMFEEVYKSASSGKLLSEIDWDIGFQFAAGAGFGLEPTDRFKKFGLSLGGYGIWYFPANNRSVKDTDWDENGKTSSYGESVASAIAGMEAEGRFSLYIPLRNKYCIEPGVSVWYSRYAAMAHNGWTKQAAPGESLNDNAQKHPLYGTSMEYLQEWIVFAPELGFKIKLKKMFFGIKTAVSPLTWGYHVDNHYFRKFDNSDPNQRYINYTDRPKGGIYYKVQGECFWEITKSMQMGINFYYQAIEKARGDTVTHTTGLVDDSYLDKGMAGAAIRNLGLGLTMRVIP